MRKNNYLQYMKKADSVNLLNPRQHLKMILLILFYPINR
jgi:hypothetical protein